MTARLFPAALLFALLLFPAHGAEPVPPALFTLADPNLEVTVWAHSPLFYNPTNLDIDKDGCVWVAEGVNYRMHFNRKPEGDRIMVLHEGRVTGFLDRTEADQVKIMELASH